MATSARVRTGQEKGLYTALLREEFSKVEISMVGYWWEFQGKLGYFQTCRLVEFGEFSNLEVNLNLLHYKASLGY